MPILIGTDEAGYGPNLGPLVVAASVFRAPKEASVGNLYERLAHCVACEPGEDDRLRIADSKSLYKPGGGLAPLEMAVLAALRMLGPPPRDWPGLWRSLARLVPGDLDSEPWHDGWEQALPVDAQEDDLTSAAARFREGIAQADVELLALQARPVFPGRFNDEVQKCGNKAEVLSLTTLRLVAELLDDLPVGSEVTVTCDKHGGRDYYAALLSHVFPDTWVRVVREGAVESIYRFAHAGRRIEVRFLMKGERMLPTALASMTAKYLREVAMIPFNAFWQRHVPGLKATAGYPSDSRRFLSDIRPACLRLQIAEETFWRSV